MIVLTRVDHRLLHGQVAFSWTQTIGADCILIANDEVAGDETKKTIIRLAKPSGVKLVIKSVADSIKAINNGATDKYKLFVVVKSIDDAYQLITNVASIKKLNLGGTKYSEDKEAISSAIFVTGTEKEELQKLSDLGIEVYAQQVPTSKRKDF